MSRYAVTEPADVKVTLTHPEFQPTLIATATSEPLDRTETGVHLQLACRVLTRGPMNAVVIGGPSRYALRQSFVADLDVRETLDRATGTWSAAIDTLESEKATTLATQLTQTVLEGQRWVLLALAF